MRILAVTSWGGACGIANYAEQLISAVHSGDTPEGEINIEPHAEALDPAWGIPNAALYDVVWLNYHRGLHSRWTPEVVHRVRQQGTPMVITFHDTYGERPPDALAQQLHDLADAFVVHEPCEGLEQQVLIRQGVPETQSPVLFDNTYFKAGYAPKQEGEYMRVPLSMPILGTAGFAFPWKSFDQLAEVTAEAGWAYLVCSNNATDADVARWTASNPWTFVVRGYQPTARIVAYLSACDATCWAYQCANSGTSGAIRLGLAARKPIIAFGGCRQFRDLQQDKPGRSSIMWSSGFEHLVEQLGVLPIQRVDPGIAYLAHRDSWAVQGAKYAAIFKGLA
jgi:hypothetical protein